LRGICASIDFIRLALKAWAVAALTKLLASREFESSAADKPEFDWLDATLFVIALMVDAGIATGGLIKPPEVICEP
jgi:hypothetical protein